MAFEFLNSFISSVVQGDLYSITVLSITFLSGYFLLSLSTGDAEPVVTPETKAAEEPEPRVLRDFTIDQLRRYNGKDEKSIYISLNFDVFDVTSARNYYGEGAE